ncbi:MAG TPA: MaoC family dehydratase [Bryobacteraceae bacterium]
MAYGRFFEELEAGQHFRHWPGRTIDEYDDTLLSLLSMNSHPLHHDEHFAGATQHGRRLVAGPTVIGIVIGMTQADIGGRALETLAYFNIRHDGPVFHGDTIYAESKIVEKRDLSDGLGVVTVSTIARNQREEPILSLQRQIVVPKGDGECKRHTPIEMRNAS